VELRKISQNVLLAADKFSRNTFNLTDLIAKIATGENYNS
jgi:hypothetical protein